MDRETKRQIPGKQLNVVARISLELKGNSLKKEGSSIWRKLSDQLQSSCTYLN